MHRQGRRTETAAPIDRGTSREESKKYNESRIVYVLLQHVTGQRYFSFDKLQQRGREKTDSGLTRPKDSGGSLCSKCKMLFQAKVEIVRNG